MQTYGTTLFFGYAVFWAVTLTGLGKFHAFDTAVLWDKQKRCRASYRLLMAFSVMSLAPIAWLVVLLALGPEGKKAGWSTVSGGALSALSVFGFIRILYAFIASSTFANRAYSEEELKEVRKVEQFDQPNDVIPHLVPGLIYLIVLGLGGALVARL